MLLGDASQTEMADRSFGRITFDDVLFELAIDTNSEAAGILADIPEVMDPETTFLTAVEGPYHPRPLIYPESMVVVSEPPPGFVEFESIDGSVRYITFSFEADTAAETLEGGLALFLERVSELGVPRVADAIDPDQFDPQLEFMSYVEYIEDDFNEDPSITISVSQNGTTFNGQALHLSDGASHVSDEAYADFLMATVILESLNGLYPLPGYIAAEVARTAGRGLDEQSELTLVRRVPLSALEAEIVANEVFLWKSDLSRLKGLLTDDMRYEDLRFDIYEDRLTGATIAVPEGMELQWDPQSGTVRAVTNNSMVTMGIAIQRHR